MPHKILSPRRTLATLLLGTACWSGSGLLAHDIPASVTVLAFVRPEGDRLRVLVRVPLEAMRDVELPLRGLGYLDLARAEPALREAAVLWIADYLEIYEEKEKLTGARLAAVRISLPSDRSFENYHTALSHITGPPLPEETQLYWQQAMLDVLLEYPIASERSRFSIRPMLAHLGQRTTTVLRFLAPSGKERVFQYSGDPGLVRLDPRWYQAAATFVRSGFDHILDGSDHLLFLLCLVIPFRRFWTLVPIVTAFTAGHSITLIASAAGMAPNSLWFPPLVETLIAFSIVLMALENIAGPKIGRRWMVAFGFGLIHGFGFSFALRENLQFAGSHLVTALLAFNFGVELGQLLVVALVIPPLAALFRWVVRERIGVVILSAIVAHTGWHWMADRAGTLSEYQFTWPALDLALLLAALRWATLALVAVGAAWLLDALYRKLSSRIESQAGPPAELAGVQRTAKQ
ncbi:hypothetical protein HRbin33_01529 [bacterium HR33]|nr:hypothetical protein HRbin33_01529 [bacterium HR33]